MYLITIADNSKNIFTVSAPNVESLISVADMCEELKYNFKVSGPTGILNQTHFVRSGYLFWSMCEGPFHKSSYDGK